MTQLGSAHHTMHKAYDRLPEPTRFLLFMVLILPGIIIGSLYSHMPTAGLIGLGWLISMLVSRACFLHVQCNHNPWRRKS